MPIKKLPTEEWHQNIPFGMRAIPHWIGHRNKKPVSVATGVAAKVNDPATWGTFEEAKRFYAATRDDPAAGVGFVFDGTEGMTFIDLDHVITGGKWTGPVEVQALFAGTSAETYVEISPSGTGLHAFGLGTLPANARHKRELPHDVKVEAYSKLHYSTVTGFRVGLSQLGSIAHRIPGIVEYIGTVDKEEAEAEVPAPERAEEIADALSHLDPDMPYDEWLRVGMALKSGLGKAGRQLWLAWSREGAKYHPGEPEEKWRSFQRGGVGLGTLIQMAHDAGWEPDATARPTAQEEFTVVADETPGLPESGFKLIPLSDVQPEKIDWLWKGFIALGHLTIVAGDPGMGKSIMTLDIASRISRGMPLPGEAAPRPPRRALVLNAEDGQADTLRPRAEAAGADLSKMIVLDIMHGGRPPQLPDDVAALEAYIKAAGDVQLVVLDPLNACVPVRLDSHKDQHIRQALQPLVEMAMRLKVAVVVVVHLNKTEDAGALLYRISGSIGIGATARSVVFVGPHPDNEGEVVVAQAKAQMGPAPASLTFRVDPSAKDADVGVVNWLGESEVGADAVVARQKEKVEPRGKLDQAAMWLEARLAGGPVEAKAIIAEARAVGFGEKTLRMAHDKIGGKRERDGGMGAAGHWVWHPPEPFKEVK